VEITLSDLRRLTIAATDGNLGGIVDLCFDDRSWTVRYPVAAGPRIRASSAAP
jgi:hypothetical protein